MLRQVIDCDRCEKPGAKAFSIPIDRRYDGAGSRENVDVVFDLCGECAALLLQRWLTDNLSFKGETTKKFLQDSDIAFREF